MTTLNKIEQAIKAVKDREVPKPIIKFIPANPGLVVGECRLVGLVKRGIRLSRLELPSPVPQTRALPYKL